MKLTALKLILKDLDVTPRKGKGQNFLLTEQVVEKMASLVDTKTIETVVEVGPGLGMLTQELLKLGKPVTAVELDKQLVLYLQEKIKNSNFHLVSADILEFDLANIKRPYVVVANLPYQITTPVLMKFLESEYPPVEMVVMVQKEVAQRICAKEGEHSILSVAVQYFGQPKIEFPVSKGNFFPIPTVDSAVIRISQIKQKDLKEAKKFFFIVRAGFSHKRKRLYSNLLDTGLYTKEKLNQIFQTLGLSEHVRAQELTMDHWSALANQS